jgi:alanine dehydrogenase
MKIGCPKEIKDNENRVGLTPNAAHAYVTAGHEVFIQKGAGSSSACNDEEYSAAGAKILTTSDEIWAAADMVVKIKEPMPSEYDKCVKISSFIHTSTSRPTRNSREPA